MDAAARHLLALINDILDLSKIEAGKFVLEEAPVDIDALLQNVVAQVSERVHAKNLRLLVGSDQLPSGLIGDPTRLRQALLNYVGNAIKFTESGRISLRVRLLATTSDERCPLAVRRRGHWHGYRAGGKREPAVLGFRSG
jgi:two-component system sensor histidine kinase/response regulator